MHPCIPSQSECVKEKQEKKKQNQICRGISIPTVSRRPDAMLPPVVSVSHAAANVRVPLSRSLTVPNRQEGWGRNRNTVINAVRLESRVQAKTNPPCSVYSIPESPSCAGPVHSCVHSSSSIIIVVVPVAFFDIFLAVFVANYLKLVAGK
jgi:hypothetical protein